MAKQSADDHSTILVSFLANRSLVMVELL